MITIKRVQVTADGAGNINRSEQHEVRDDEGNVINYNSNQPSQPKRPLLESEVDEVAGMPVRQDNFMANAMDNFKMMGQQMEELSRALVLDPFNDDFFDIFTKKRMELVRSIMSNQPSSIRELAMNVDRDVKNVFDDLRILENVNIINFVDCGKCRKPVVKSKTIIFRINRGDINE